ncbi:hypothetical protein [Actinoallomurus sp. NPDC052274]|uniref:hypothetical protein n=1 Tax=Actinoallomurus sp. NPDC052274 TaxID=3155420 RepID=UPI00342F9D02
MSAKRDLAPHPRPVVQSTGRPLVVEAARLGIGLDELLGLVREELASAEVTAGERA